MNGVIQVGESENGKQLELRLSQTLRIALSETPTTGYRWCLRPSRERVVSLVRDSMVPPGERLGGTVLHCWDFQAAEVGTARIELECLRAWERQPAATRIFSVTVLVT